MELLKKLVPHILAGTILFVALFYASMGMLSAYTNHKKTVSVPNFVGMDGATFDAEKYEDLVVVIKDSVYLSDQPAGIILKQEPEPEDVVKEGRTVYLQMNSVLPESTRVPRLVDMSPRQAKQTLAALGFEEGESVIVKDTFAVVLGVRCEGKFVNSGDRIDKGAELQLVMGDGRPRF